MTHDEWTLPADPEMATQLLRERSREIPVLSERFQF